MMKATKRHNNKYSTKVVDFFGKKRIREVAALTIPRFKEFTLKELTIFILILLITIGLSLFIFNQFLELKYKQELLLTPCEICKEINKQNRGFINWSNITILSSPTSPEVDLLSPEVYPA